MAVELLTTEKHMWCQSEPRLDQDVFYNAKYTE